MCGILAILSDEINNERAKNSLLKLNHRGPDEEGEFTYNNVYLGHKRLVVVDKENGKQPYCFNEFVLVYNGELYNTNELRADLIRKGYAFSGYSDTEVLIKMYAEYREKCAEKLNGIFAFVVFDKNTNQTFACRDRCGVKPLYYYHNAGELMFSSEIKSILNYYQIKTVDLNSLREILGLGPSHTPGNGIYPNVFELRAGHYLTYFKNKLTIKRYWNVQAKLHTDDFADTAHKVRFLLEDSIKRQLVSDVPLCFFLSGGIDSTTITLLAKKYKPEIETYSFDYVDNEKFFLKNDFQVSQDNEFIKLVTERFNITHHNLVINNEQLTDSLYDALLLKDYPGMADIDSSLYWYAKQVKKDFTVALSGECADEIFGGYPWFYREQNDSGFPWIRNLEERNNLLNEKFRGKLDLIDYVNEKYKQSVLEAPLTGFESPQDKKHKELTYLNMNWFMQTLLDRKDRMTMGASLEVRVPFADHRLVEYLYNVPWSFKFYGKQEKGLLREAVKDIVPAEILNRKKNPYPKTHNPAYLNNVKKFLNNSLQEDSILSELFDKKALTDLLNEETPQKPWFGQLMTRPQLIAYLYQFHLWFKHYDLNIKC